MAETQKTGTKKEKAPNWAKRLVAGFAGLFRKIKSLFVRGEPMVVEINVRPDVPQQAAPVATATAAPRIAAPQLQQEQPQPEQQPRQQQQYAAATAQQPALRQQWQRQAPSPSPAPFIPPPLSAPEARAAPVAQAYVPQAQAEGRLSFFGLLYKVAQALETAAHVTKTVTRHAARSGVAFVLAALVPVSAFAMMGGARTEDDRQRDNSAEVDDYRMRQAFNYTAGAYDAGYNSVRSGVSRAPASAAKKKVAASRPAAGKPARKTRSAGDSFYAAAARDRTPLPGGFLPNMLRVEGRGQNVASIAAGKHRSEAAYGKGQFMPKTWPHVVKNCAPEVAATKTDAEIAEMRYVDDAFKDRMINCLARANRAFAANKLGREPTDAEQYMLWQQGTGGFSALHDNPDMNAIDALDTVVSRKTAAASILGNGGTAAMTAREFMVHWSHHFEPRAKQPATVQEAKKDGFIGVKVNLASVPALYP